MKLKALKIRRFPGIQAARCISNLDKKLTVILGPNASGKTTLCRVIRALLWPQTLSTSSIDIEADWELAGKRLTVKRCGQNVTWVSENGETTPPPLPTYLAASCYTIEGRELLIDSAQTEEHIIAEMCRLMAGGYDVKKVQNELVTIRPRHGKNEESRVRKAIKDSSILRASLSALSEENERLKVLKEEVEKAVQAQRQKAQISSAIQIVTLQNTIDEIEEKINTYPTHLHSLKGSEEQEAEALLAQISAIRTELESEENRAKEISDQIAALPFSKTVLSQEKIEYREKQCHQFERLEERYLEGKEAVYRFKDRGEDLQEDLDKEELIALENLIRQHSEIENDILSMRSRIQTLEKEDVDPVSASLLSEFSSLLEGWIMHETQQIPWTLSKKIWALDSCLIIACIACTLLKPEIGAYAAFVTGLSLFTRILLQRHARQAWDPNPWKNKLESHPLWKEADLDLSRMQEFADLYKKRAIAANLAETQDAQASSLKDLILDLEKEKEPLDTKLETVSQSIGFDYVKGSPMRLALFDYAQKLQSSHIFHEEEKKARAEYLALELRYNEELAKINAFFQEQLQEDVADATEAISVFSHLRKMNEERKSLLETKDHIQNTSNKLLRSLEALEKKNTLLYKLTGLPLNALSELKTTMKDFSDLNDLKNEKKRVEKAIQKLKLEEETPPELLKKSIDELISRKHACQELSEGIEDQAKEIGAIEEAVRRSQKDKQLESALHNLDSAEEALKQCRQEAIEGQMTEFLLTEVQNEHEQLSRPELLEKADERFKLFTHHKYQLAFDAETTRFSALESETQMQKSLSELSTGTKTQLLLAIRLAYLEHIERGNEPLPLFLDEVLMASDPERFDAITKCLVLWTNEGDRQLFYLSANPNDAQAWKSADADLHILSLQDELDSQWSVRDLELRKAKVIPSPMMKSAEDYAKLIQVPKVEAYSPLSSLHLFYLLHEDLETLHSLLSKQIVSCGQWIAASKLNASKALLPEEKRQALDAKCEIAESVFSFYNVGRGKLLNDQAFERAEISDTYFDRFCSLAKDCEGSAKQFMQALEAKEDPRSLRFRESHREQLKSFLIQEAYLDQREPLEASAIHLAVLADKGKLLESESISQQVFHLLDVLKGSAKQDKELLCS